MPNLRSQVDSEIDWDAIYSSVFIGFFEREPNWGIYDPSQIIESVLENLSYVPQLEVLIMPDDDKQKLTQAFVNFFNTINARSVIALTLATSPDGKVNTIDLIMKMGKLCGCEKEIELRIKAAEQELNG